MNPSEQSLAAMAGELKTKKQYIKDYIIAYGYDEDDFNHYLSYQKEEGQDIHNWTVDEFSQVIREYYAYLDPNYNQQAAD